MKIFEFQINFIEYVSIGSDDSLAPNSRQAIIWSNDEQVYWRIYASPGISELMTWNFLPSAHSGWSVLSCPVPSVGLSIRPSCSRYRSTDHDV